MACIGGADNIQDTVLLVQDAWEFLHFQRDGLDCLVALQVEHGVHQRNEQRVVLFFGKDDLEYAVAQDVGVLVELLVLGEVVLVDFHGLEHGCVLTTVHFELSFLA